MDLCKHLRWKSITRDLEDPEQIAWAFARNQVPYSCLRTCHSWGPDDELAAPERCRSGRACYVAAPLARRLAKPEPE